MLKRPQLLKNKETKYSENMDLEMQKFQGQDLTQYESECLEEETKHRQNQNNINSNSLFDLVPIIIFFAFVLIYISK